MSLREPSREQSTDASRTAPREAACPECDGDLLNDEQSTRVCDQCGLVVGRDDLDRGPDWYRDTESEERQTGPARTVTRHDGGLSSQVGYGNKGFREMAETAAQASRLRQLAAQSKYESKRERNLAHGLREVQRIASALGLAESLHEQGCVLFKSAQKEDFLLGRSIEAVAAAAVYGVCRCQGHPIRFEQVGAVSKVAVERIKSAYRTLNRELGLPAQPESPAEYVPSLAAELNVSDQVRRRARQLADDAEYQGVTIGKSPSGFAAGCLYAAGREFPEGRTLTQEEVTEAADATAATVRAHWQRLKARGLFKRPG